jgi:phosphoribosylanthranilate isomerase
MIIKICGMRDAENIREVAKLGIDMIGFIFWPESPRFVKMISAQAGIIPDYSEERLKNAKESLSECQNEQLRMPKRAGVFVNDMPQNIVTRAVNYELDIIQLHGSESVIMIDNLRSTLAPSIRKGIKFMKALSISTAEDILRYKEYEGHVDYFIFDTQTPLVGGSGNHFDWNMLDAYDGNTPFILSGGVGPDDAERVLSIRHPMFAGIDLNSQFETAPAVKNVDALKAFLAKIR